MTAIQGRVRFSHQSGTLGAMRRLANNADDLADGAANVLHKTAVMTAPIRTGRLKKSITTKKAGDRTYVVMVGAYYGIYVNYGTRHHPPQPFFAAAVTAGKTYLTVNGRRIFR